jgi:hypothetical protein
LWLPSARIRIRANATLVFHLSLTFFSVVIRHFFNYRIYLKSGLLLGGGEGGLEGEQAVLLAEGRLLLAGQILLQAGHLSVKPSRLKYIITINVAYLLK